jgi:plastocyanin
MPRRFAGWLTTSLLLMASVGCQGTETPAVRESTSGNQARTASAEKTVHQGADKAESAAAHDAQQPSPANKVSIDNFTFNPETLEVPAGTKVIWVNGDDVPHTVRSVEDTFRSGTLDTDDVYERVFSEPGTYEYYCGVHRHMTGKIVVK